MALHWNIDEPGLKTSLSSIGVGYYWAYCEFHGGRWCRCCFVVIMILILSENTYFLTTVALLLTQKNVTPAQASFICAIVLTYCFVSPTSLFIGSFVVNPNVPGNLWAFSNTFRFRKIPSELGLLFQESLVGKNLTRILKACNYLAAFDQETSNRCQWGN